MQEYISDLSYVMQLPKPLEEYSKEEQEAIAIQKMRLMIDESDFNADAPRHAKAIRTEKQRDSYCRRIYQNTSTSSDFDYLYRNVDKKVKDKSGIIKTLSLKQPAEVRHIPIVSPKLRALISREKMRPFKFRAYGIDGDTIERKNDARVKDIVSKYSLRVSERIQAYNMHNEALEMRKQMMAQYAQDPQAAPLIQQLTAQMELMQEVIYRDITLSEKDRDDINKYYKYSYRDFQEVNCQKLIQGFIENNRLRTLFNKAFEEKLITDKPIYYVDYRPGMKEPDFELVRPEYLDYQYSEDCDYIEDTGWAVRLTYLTFEEIIVKYGAHLTKSDVERIKSEMPRRSSRSNSNLDKLPDGTFVGLDDRHHHAAHNELYAVYTCFWKEYAAVPALVKKNKNESKYLSSKPDFISFKTVDEIKEMTNSEYKRKKLAKDGTKVTVRYRVDLWEGIRIGEETWTMVGKRDFQDRDPYKPYDVKLPFVGKNIYRFNQPRSLVWECRDIQELFNILHYQEELLIALSGVKGVVYDLSQKPEGMSPAEVAYYMRQGIMYIKTVKSNGKKVNTSFNQFQSFDQTISPAIQYINAMKQNLINLVSMITGIYQNLEGQVAHTDQVGTMQMSIQQSAASVESYFQEMEDLNERALTRLANLFEGAAEHGFSGSYVLNKIEQEVYTIPPGTFNGKFRIIVNSGIKEKEAIDAAKQIAMSKLQRAEITGSQYLNILDMDNIVEMRKFFAESEDKMMKIAEQTQNNAHQQQMQMQQMQQEMEMQSKQFEAQLQERLKQLEIQVKARELQIKEQDMLLDNAIEKERVQIEREKYQSERDIEERYLEFQKQELAINAMNQRASMFIDKTKAKMDFISKSRPKERIKD